MYFEQLNLLKIHYGFELHKHTPYKNIKSTKDSNYIYNYHKLY